MGTNDPPAANGTRPTKLGEGAAKTKVDLLAYREAEKRGKGKEFAAAIDSGIYGDKTVKQALIRMQHGKCAFCEAQVRHVAHGDIEHFRPKNGWVQGDEPLNKPGYFWLAYTWENLLFSCQLCNQRHKKNHFPLLNPNRRATPARRSVRPEKPVFVNPYEEEPEKHISFNQHVIVDLSERDKKTITGLGLDRKELSENRRSFLKKLKLLSQWPPNHEMYGEAQALLAEAQDASSQYSAMIRTLMRSSPASG